MAFARLETTARNHRKFRRLDAGAIGLWAMGLIYCQDQLTDGRIPADEIPLLISATPLRRLTVYAEALVQAGLWERAGPDCFVVHDYLDWNPSKDQVMKDRAASKERMRALRSGERSTTVRKNTQRTYADRSPSVRRSFADRSRQDVDVDERRNDGSAEQRPNSQVATGRSGLDANGCRWRDGVRVAWPRSPDGARCSHGCKPDDTGHVCLPD